MVLIHGRVHKEQNITKTLNVMFDFDQLIIECDLQKDCLVRGVSI